MDIAHIDGATRVLGAPKDWDQERDGLCDVLPIRDEMHSPGVTRMVSEWKPTPEELSMLLAGGRVYLSVIGVSHPPVALYVDAMPEGA